MLNERYELAAAAVKSATALMIGAGAGMGVDSGLPDFRGPEGFWKAYPPFHGKQFHEMSTPHWFRTDPQLAWGFFGHRWRLYHSATPHAGFQILRGWADRIPCFVFTSNVDGQFQKAGFAESQIFECHGSIHYQQCTRLCSRKIWPAAPIDLQIDMATIRATSELPQCRHCASVARPNILMFGDYDWIADRTDEQDNQWQKWLNSIDASQLVTIEIGAGLAIPTVRYQCESLPGTLIRINPRDPQVPANGISLPVGALEGLRRIERAMLSHA